MFNERIPTKQLTTWLCGAILPVWIQLSAGEAWLTVAVTAVLSIAAVWAVWHWGRFESKVLLGLSILFQVLLLGTLMPYAARVWPGGNQYPAVPLGILILSVWSAWKGPRAAAAVDKAAGLKGPVIFAVGNAPTALYSICDLYRAGKLNPEMVIGVPVGFVNVVEAEELILETEVPHIVARGRKGGSNVAAAIVNALLYELDPSRGIQKI